MKASEVAAWWGAVIATFLLIWDVYKWNKSHSNVRVIASPNMHTVDKIYGGHDKDKNIFVEVVNRGDKIVVITHLVVKHYTNIWEKIRGKPSTQAIIPNPGGNQPIPFELGPGKRWTGLIKQDDVEKISGNIGFTFCGILHTARKKGEFVLVKLK